MNDIDWKIQLFALISVCYTVFKFIIYLFGQKDIELSANKRYILVWIVVIGVVWPYWHFVESNSIKDGEIYYVNMFEKIDSQKNYRVPATIYKGEDGYSLGSVYWSNGGELYFDSGYEDLIIGEKVSMSDEEGKEWFIELTDQKAEIPK